jgi:2-polyprenyl-3-methyl-5-hydroxy-6-metoxy-1,4-benzoquinol methylase
MFKQKVKYFLQSTGKRFVGQVNRCPSCGETDYQMIGKKYLVTELRKCQSCKLLYRYPLDTVGDNEKFYQTEYSQGFTTDCPSKEYLQKMIKKEFSGYEKDYAIYLEVLDALGICRGAKVIDFGCSWGYGTWQLKKAGYSVQGFEISHTRAEYGRVELKLPIVESTEKIESGAEVFFSCHVLEHVPSIHGVVMKAKNYVKKGGLFIAFTPNGSDEFRRKNEKNFQKLWGKVHPNLLTAEFYEQIFYKYPLLLASSFYDIQEIKKWDKKRDLTLDLSGDELMAVAIL